MSNPYQSPDPTQHDPYGASSDPYAAPAPSDPFASPAPSDPYASPTPYTAPGGYSPSAYSTSPTSYQSAAPVEPTYNAYEAGGYAQYGQQTPYVQPGYPPGYPMVLPDHPQATMVLVLGIVGFVVSGLTAPFAWYFGSKARKEIQANPGVYKDSGMLTVGWVLGIIGTCGLILAALLIILYFVFIIVMIAATTY